MAPGTTGGGIFPAGEGPPRRNDTTGMDPVAAKTADDPILSAGGAPPDPRPARAALLERLARDPFDLLVIGGGITGAGIARDAALRGLRVALVERDDFGAGTSSRSSRLVHGGVRYLEHGYLHLVFESSRERRTLLRIAPHLVRPLAFTWPVYRGARVPRWKLSAGLFLYDALALFRNIRSHRPLGPRGVRKREPAVAQTMNGRPLRGGAVYYDAATDDARLTLATALSAAEAGAVVVNHAEAVALSHATEPGAAAPRVAGAEVRDCLGGARALVRASVVVNAAGPWSDQVRRLENPAAAAGVRGTKGVHILVPRERIRNRGALTLIAPRDGRVVFVLPAGPHTVIGTTDTPTDAAPEEVRATRADVDYLLDVANAYFPWSELTEGDVISAWAGIRPLAAGGSAKDPAASSREHALHESPAGLLSITGGKLTTYRSMAAEVVDAVERRLGRAPAPPRTADLPLPNAVSSLEFETRLAQAVVRDDIVAQHLVESYGTAWRAVWALARRDPWLHGRVVSHLPVLRAEFAYAVGRELALTIADVLMRRTKLAFETRGAALETAVADCAAVLAAALGWSAAEREEAVAEYRVEHARVFAVEG